MGPFVILTHCFFFLFTFCTHARWFEHEQAPWMNFEEMSGSAMERRPAMAGMCRTRRDHKGEIRQGGLHKDDGVV